MEIDQAYSVLAAHADYRILRRVQVADDQVFAQNTTGEAVGRLAVIDTETTGLNPELDDRIIDIAIATCEYGRESGKLYRIISRYESLEDPECPISPDITRLTGITDEMVRGKRIVESEVLRTLEGVGLIVCHNAGFDRAFLEARFPSFANLHFACSLNEVPWDRWNVASSKLDYLGFRFGLFNEAHRARADVDMLISLLDQKIPDAEGTILSLLLESARSPSWRIHAIGLPYDNKEFAKARGYRWHDGKFNIAQSWWIDTKDEAAERAFLAQVGCKKPRVWKLTARERYRSLGALSELKEAASNEVES